MHCTGFVFSKAEADDKQNTTSVSLSRIWTHSVQTNLVNTKRNLKSSKPPQFARIFNPFVLAKLANTRFIDLRWFRGFLPVTQKWRWSRRWMKRRQGRTLVRLGNGPEWKFPHRFSSLLFGYGGKMEPFYFLLGWLIDIILVRFGGFLVWGWVCWFWGGDTDQVNFYFFLLSRATTWVHLKEKTVVEVQWMKQVL